MTQIKGIDVSNYQGKIDWKKVSASGINFALIRAGYGNDIKQKDAAFDANVQGALASGLKVGAYWFSYAISAADAAKEAEVCKKVIAPYKGKLSFPIAFDYEYDSVTYSKKQGVNPSNALTDSIARAFIDSMKADGWFVSLYTNIDFIKSGKFSVATIKAYDVWLADYAGGADYPCGIQQTGSTGTVNGISGNVDTDVSFKDYSTIICSGGYNGYRKPQNFRCDTCADHFLTLGQAYQFKLTSTVPLTVSVGTSDVVTLLHRYTSCNDTFYYIVGIGKSGAAAGIYVNNIKQFVARIK